MFATKILNNRYVYIYEIEREKKKSNIYFYACNKAEKFETKILNNRYAYIYIYKRDRAKKIYIYLYIPIVITQFEDGHGKPAPLNTN